MPHPVPSFAHARTRAAAVARAARPRLAAATTAATLLALSASMLLAPRQAHASDPYQDCLDAVHALAERCLKSSSTWVGDFACMWLGGMGYITCAILEALKQLIPIIGGNIS